MSNDKTIKTIFPTCHACHLVISHWIEDDKLIQNCGCKIRTPPAPIAEGMHSTHLKGWHIRGKHHDWIIIYDLEVQTLTGYIQGENQHRWQLNRDPSIQGKERDQWRIKNQPNMTMQPQRLKYISFDEMSVAYFLNIQFSSFGFRLGLPKSGTTSDVERALIRAIRNMKLAERITDSNKPLRKTLTTLDLTELVALSRMVGSGDFGDEAKEQVAAEIEARTRS